MYHLRINHGQIPNLKNDYCDCITLLDKIIAHLLALDLDVRKSHFSRFTDQKCTPDVVSFIADCIREYITDDLNKQFEVMDVWKSPFAVENTINIFNKPSPENDAAVSEYNKFFGQPMRLLDYAGVLDSQKDGNTHVYKCAKPEILGFIALKADNALDFLYVYLKKVLHDSGFIGKIIIYRKNQTKDSLQELKDAFMKFMHDNTPVTGTYEPNRIFPKILNIFAVKQNMKGIERGYITDHVFYHSDLMYNDINWRDEGEKDKRTTRNEYLLLEEQRPQYADYEITKAKNLLERIHGSVSEIQDEWANGDATQKHHIFPKSVYPEFAADIENLITLTPTQHFTKAHPGNDTNRIDKEYQRLMLIAKSHSIERSRTRNEFHYMKERFVEILNAGLELGLSDDASFDEIRDKLS